MYIANKNKYRYQVEWVCKKKNGNTENMIIHVTGLNGVKVFEDLATFKDWIEDLLLEEIYDPE